MNEIEVEGSHEFKQETEKVYKCGKGSKIFNANDKFPCEICGTKLRGAYELKEHLARHGDERNNECDQCGKTFKCKNDLSAHKRVVHATERPFQCEACSKSFTKAFFLKVHFIKHSEERPNKCDQCALAFKTRKGLNYHIIRIHEKGGKFPCDVCGRSFMFMARLNDHLSRHSDERKHVCDQCGTSFNVKGDLAQHKKYVHTEKPVGTSSKNYKEESTLEHSSIKLHKCDECSTTYKTQHALTQHKFWKHTQGGKYSCDVCGKEFKVPSALKLHLMRHSDERHFKCDQCDKTFKIKGHLTGHKFHAHATERPFQCEVCPKSYVTAAILKLHSKKHGKEKQHKCDHCCEVFETLQSMNNHKVQDHVVDVKVEPVVIYDSEIKQVVLDERIKTEMDLDVKQEPQGIDES